MCHFLTISVPGKKVPSVPPAFRRKIRFGEHTNRSVTQHAPPDWTCFTATSGGCSCGFYCAPNDDPVDKSKLERKYRKKGWSDEKTQRALESQREDSTQSAGLRDDILELIARLTTEFGEVRLGLHWYSGDVETENFTLNDAGIVSLTDFRQDPTALQEETTLTIKCGQGVSLNT